MDFRAGAVAPVSDVDRANAFYTRKVDPDPDRDASPECAEPSTRCGMERSPFKRVCRSPAGHEPRGAMAPMGFRYSAPSVGLSPGGSPLSRVHLHAESGPTAPSADWERSPKSLGVADLTKTWLTCRHDSS